MGILRDVLAAFQFLTRLPLPSMRGEVPPLSRAIPFFPVVGLVVALGAIGLQRLLQAHLTQPVLAVLLLTYLVVITGALHEDGLADTADGFGGGWNRDKILLIMRDSRIGSFGAIAIALSLLARYTFLSTIPLVKLPSYLVAAEVLCRWTALPLSLLLKPARETDGQGATIARKTSIPSLLLGTFLAFAIVGAALRSAIWLPAAAALLVTSGSALYYRSQIGGVTGDCFGATTQITAIGVYLCGTLL